MSAKKIQHPTSEIRNLGTMRHSCAHLMALAVKELYPGVKFGIGPAIDDGFYYDFDFSEIKVVNSKSQISNSKQIPNPKFQIPKQEFKLTPEGLPKIEKKMRQLAKKNLKFEKRELLIKEAKKIFQNQPYKLELINDIENESKQNLQPTTYKLQAFLDLCKGPHVSSTSQIKAFKLTKIAGAYWKGNEKNKMLTRIYGVAFSTQKELDEYLKLQEQAEARDHRKLGQELDLFSLPQETGSGLPIWHPKGALLRKIIEKFWEDEHQKRGYNLVYSPHIANLEIWKKSGHWNFYRENMYSPIEIDKEKYLIKPMNCPFHILIFKNKIKSYRELPIRYAELGTVYRHERSGVLHGLTRVRGFTQDDAHIFCSKNQLEQELIKVIKLAGFMMKTFDFKNYRAYLSTKPEKAIGSDKIWKKATKALENALNKTKIKYEIDPGEGVFYGPKIDIKYEDTIGREWQGPTLHVDFNFPEKLNVEYINEKGKKENAVMIHRTVLGSMERFIGILIEHYAGAFPVWLAPEQVRIIPVGKAHIKPSQNLTKKLKQDNIRCEIDDLNETVSYKIRKAEKQKIPYVLVIGDKEAKGKNLNVRIRGQKPIKKMTLTKFMEKVKMEVRKKS